MAESSTILVTGITGFLGSHIVDQLFKAGYRVKGTVRSSKVTDTADRYAVYKDQIKVVAFDDLIHGDYTEILKGVDAIIHQAAPMPGKEAGPQAQIDAAVEGNLNILRQAEKAGITKVVFASSWGAVKDPRFPLQPRIYTEEDWNTVTREEALDGTRDSFFVYVCEKALSERAVWEFAEKHPHIDVTAIIAPFFLGPFLPTRPIPEPKTSALGTNRFMYSLILPSGTQRESVAKTVDVRDVAWAMVKALSASPVTNGKRKRILITAEWYSWTDALECIAAERPELKDRLAVALKESEPVKLTGMDTTRAKELLGFEARPWKVSLIETIDALLEWEKYWTKKGQSIVL